jgi:hypothetical protein
MHVTLGVKCKVQRSCGHILTKAKAEGIESILIELVLRTAVKKVLATKEFSVILISEKGVGRRS